MTTSVHVCQPSPLPEVAGRQNPQLCGEYLQISQGIAVLANTKDNAKTTDMIRFMPYLHFY